MFLQLSYMSKDDNASDQEKKGGCEESLILANEHSTRNRFLDAERVCVVCVCWIGLKNVTSFDFAAAPTTPSNSNATNLSIPEQFRDVVKMNDYLTTGRRQEFWEEPFTRRLMDAIKDRKSVV